MNNKIRCNDCEHVFSNDDIEKELKGDISCPNCGSKHQTVTVTISEQITSYDQLRGKVNEDGRKKPIKEFISGSELYVDRGDIVNKQRVIDRVNDYYMELVTDQDGNIIKHDEGKLSEHRGHGSAKH
ncbi:MAG: zinc ribbon domain-containing protein [Nitrospirae bacterium]|nr:zinc ribbon domain-containing protein [Nitrospirota bacterium]